ncbi:MAG: AMP-binding protein [Actinomycetota bacterium]|nr:AMP-binding protein [Actinomycetota bacterium]
MILDEAFEAFREAPSRAAVTEGPDSWTWAEFVESVARTARDLDGGSTDGPVGILLRSGSRYLSSFLAITTLGRPACTLHPDWADRELEAAITDAGITEVITDRTDLPVDVGAAQPGPGARDRDGDDPVFYIGITSGTSGRPKPFARRERSWTSSFGPAGELFEVNRGDQVFLPGSLQHSHFLFGAVFALNRGASVRLFDRFDAARLASELADTSRGVLYLVPTMLIALNELEGEPFGGVHSVVVSGAKMESHHWEIVRRLFPDALVCEIFGASELSFVTVNTRGERPGDPGYVGEPFPGVELEIRTPGDEAEDEPGLVYVRSPYLFDGYLEGSETNSPVGADGFMTVGDMGFLTDEGLSLAGRASNLIITGGKNVHPEEIEAQVTDHPAVAECVAVGVPHPRWGEEIVAFVVTSGTGAGPDADSLRNFLRPRVASYRIPKRWFIVDELPQTRAGKTDRSQVRLFEDAIELGP